MESRDVLIDAYTRIQELAHTAADGLAVEGLTYRPETDANSIAWLVWHLARTQDSQVAPIAGTAQAWATGDWAERLGLDPALSNTGYGYTSEQVAAVQPASADALLGYLDFVSDRSREYLRSVDAAELDRIIDTSYDPPVSVGVRLVSIISDNIQHAGQARYVRGIYDRVAGAGQG
ncbi:MAG: DinB family protein [Chloroflexi bacterium]|nr:DinB family protein [Chloroflexota bacterium]MCH8102420.1 DinB family protein [Chloroflexota bacterium]